MKKEICNPSYKGELQMLDVAQYVSESDFCVKVLSREIEQQKINIKSAQIVVIGVYGMASGKKI